jgi:GNAT superfamily N-acetyltransferase
MGAGKARSNIATRVDPQPVHQPALRRRGIGRRLTETIIDWCRQQDFEWVYLHASEQGRPLHESLGFMSSSEMRPKL